MTYISKSNVQKTLLEHYQKTEQQEKTLHSVKDFLLQILGHKDIAASDGKLSPFDIFVYPGLANFEIFQDTDKLLGLLDYILSKDDIDIKNNKYIYADHKLIFKEEVKFELGTTDGNKSTGMTNKPISDLDTPADRLGGSDNTDNVYISAEGITKINNILTHIKDYYRRYQPKILSVFVCQMYKISPELVNPDTMDIAIDIGPDKSPQANTRSFIKFLQNILLTDNDNDKTSQVPSSNNNLTKRVKKILKNLFKNNRHKQNSASGPAGNETLGPSVNFDFTKKSVLGGYILMFYIFSHLMNTDIFVNRNANFMKFWDEHLISGKKNKSDKSTIHTDEIGFSDNISRKTEITDSKLGDYYIIGNTKTTNSTVKKLLGNRESNFANKMVDLCRCTMISGDYKQLTMIINHYYIYFKNKKIDFKIKDKGVARKILESAKINKIVLDKGLREKLETLLRSSTKKDSTSSEYEEIKFIINDRGIKFEIKFMTEANFQKDEHGQNASKHIYKNFEQMKLKCRNKKILTRDYILEFWASKILKDSDNDKNIIKIIYGEYNDKNIGLFLKNLTSGDNDINKKYSPVMLDNSIGYINKSEKIQAQKNDYLPEIIDISSDPKYKIYAHDIKTQLDEITNKNLTK